MFGLKIDKLVMDVDNDSLEDDLGFLTPKRSRGFFKQRLTNSLTLYYRFESCYTFYYIVLSFDSQGAYAPKSLPILFYWHESMLSVWDALGDEDDSD
jgi:hypothetical protein